MKRVWMTSDGAEFPTKPEAKRHEVRLRLVKRIEAALEAAGGDENKAFAIEAVIANDAAGWIADIRPLVPPRKYSPRKAKAESKSVKAAA